MRQIFPCLSSIAITLTSIPLRLNTLNTRRKIVLLISSLQTEPFSHPTAQGPLSKSRNSSINNRKKMNFYSHQEENQQGRMGERVPLFSASNPQSALQPGLPIFFDNLFIFRQVSLLIDNPSAHSHQPTRVAI